MLSTPGALEGAAVVSARIEEVRFKKKKQRWVKMIDQNVFVVDPLLFNPRHPLPTPLQPPAVARRVPGTPAPPGAGHAAGVLQKGWLHGVVVCGGPRGPGSDVHAVHGAQGGD